MNLTALPLRLVVIRVQTRTQFGVWCQSLSCVVFSSDDKPTAMSFLTELRTLVATGMSHNAAIALLYSVR